MTYRRSALVPCFLLVFALSNPGTKARAENLITGTIKTVVEGTADLVKTTGQGAWNVAKATAGGAWKVTSTVGKGVWDVSAATVGTVAKTGKEAVCATFDIAKTATGGAIDTIGAGFGVLGFGSPSSGAKPARVAPAPNKAAGDAPEGRAADEGGPARDAPEETTEGDTADDVETDTIPTIVLE